ncbi:flagellar biosynthesis protein FliQ [Brachyspira aalborgi]|uniref:Flagellar biosynthetic protein FliQ n=1 Tax=Brachyspira aalborgi TaxID=29522 RepID=A0A5C8FQP2_9SPIR|nr:flagellar biosynthesis protein FliQ [Brachyspira aalborgi]TXJ51900.1 flagellar biosynthetic protein FliQ [Brachyspira aalborgi]
MSDTSIVVLVQETLWTFMLLVSPILGVSILVGLIISILQATTSIQEQTLTFVPKMIAMLTVIYFLASWMLNYISSFTVRLFSILPTIAR